MDFLGFELPSVIHLSFNLGHLTSPSVSFFTCKIGVVRGLTLQNGGQSEVRSCRCGIKEHQGYHPLKLCSVHLVQMWLIHSFCMGMANIPIKHSVLVLKLQEISLPRGTPISLHSPRVLRALMLFHCLKCVILLLTQGPFMLARFSANFLPSLCPEFSSLLYVWPSFLSLRSYLQYYPPRGAFCMHLD